MLVLSLLLSPLAPPSRASPPCMCMPREIRGIDCQRKLAGLSFRVVTSVSATPESVLAGEVRAPDAGEEEVTIDLYYGQLTSGEAAGTRVIIKCYSGAAPSAPPLKLGDYVLTGGFLCGVLCEVTADVQGLAAALSMTGRANYQ